MKMGIHNVFILKENILFIEEWIQYHILLGFTDFYLYDNSDVNTNLGFDKNKKHLIPGKVNKYNINYDEILKMRNIELTNYLDKLKQKYNNNNINIKIIKWSPKDTNGKILYNQVEAHIHCLELLKKDKIDWCAYIDLDEFIVLKNNNNIKNYINLLSNNYSNILLNQIHYDSRFNNLDKNVIDIKKSVKTPKIDYAKNIFKVEDINKIISPHLVELKNNKKHSRISSDIWINHYNRSNIDIYIERDNINLDIKTKLNKIKKKYLNK